MKKWEDDKMKTIYHKIRRSILTLLCMAAVIAACMPKCAVPVKAAKVSSGEKKKIQKLIDDNVIHYIEGACNYPAKLDKLTFNDKIKTDIAFHNVAYDRTVFSQYSSDAVWMEKYKPYGGVFRYTDSVKAAVKKKGRSLFGKAFQISFAVGDGFSTSSNYPLSHDKKYVLMNFTDWGDWYVSHKYKKIDKKNQTYTAQIKISSYWGGAEDEVTDYLFRVDLKKENQAFIVTNIVVQN